MRTKLAAIAALAIAAITLTAVASAGSTATKQRVGIQVTKGGFVLTPLTAGPIKPDTGTASFCCWTQRSIIRDGQAIDINNPQMTLTGKQGTLVTRNVIGWTDVPDGYSLFTGTWKVIRATGVYAGLTGGGGAAGVGLPNGNTNAMFEGFLNSK
jgi:hypothetical protein